MRRGQNRNGNLIIITTRRVKPGGGGTSVPTLSFSLTYTHTPQQKKEEGGSSVSKSVVFNKQPNPVQWHLTKNKDEYNLLTVSSKNLLDHSCNKYFNLIG